MTKIQLSFWIFDLIISVLPSLLVRHLKNNIVWDFFSLLNLKIYKKNWKNRIEFFYPNSILHTWKSKWEELFFFFLIYLISKLHKLKTNPNQIYSLYLSRYRGNLDIHCYPTSFCDPSVVTWPNHRPYLYRHSLKILYLDIIFLVEFVICENNFFLKFATGWDKFCLWFIWKFLFFAFRYVLPQILRKKLNFFISFLFVFHWI